MGREDYTLEQAYSWGELVCDIEALASAIRTEYRPDVVLAVAEGGWIPARLLKNYVDAKYLSIGCNSYDTDESMLPSPLIYQVPDEDEICGKAVLIVDEVCESGRTLAAVTERIRSIRPSELRSAVLHRKRIARFTPDYVVHEVAAIWIVYPWVKQRGAG